MADTDFLREIKEQIEQARSSLLDLSMRNSLLNFRHSDRGSPQIRIVNNNLDELFQHIVAMKSLQLEPLPALINEPLDEQTTQFKRTFDNILESDPEYLEKHKDSIELKEDEEEYLIRKIKDKARIKLGLPELKERNTPTKVEWAKHNNINPNYENEIISQNKNDFKKLQTLLYPTEFNSRITALRRLIRSDKEEKGACTLYVALGFLEWTESEISKKNYQAPLLLLKLDDLVKNSRGNVLIETSGELPQINISLQEKLKDFHIVLPLFEDADTPDEYFKKVTKAIKTQPTWSIKKYITIGRFGFSRLAMYEDLDLSNWPQLAQKIESGDNLLSVIFKTKNVPLSEEIYDIDRDERIRKYAPLLISSTDSSQHSAIADAIQGDNLVIKGPPGTGKSQTITNLIANALHAQKKVLFVAEKKAALEVVFSRLKAANLGDYCLELYSEKLKITHIRSELEKAVQRYKEKSGSVITPLAKRKNIELLRIQKENLRTYYDSLQQKVGSTELSLYDVIWQYNHFRNLLEKLPYTFEGLQIFNIDNIDKKEYNRVCEELDKIEELSQKYQKYIANNKKWQKLNFTNVSNKDIQSLALKFKNIAESLNENISFLDELISEYNLSLNKTKNDLLNLREFLVKSLAFIKDNIIEYNLLKRIDSVKKLDLIVSFCVGVKKSLEKYSKIKTLYRNTEYTLAEKGISKEILDKLENEFDIEDMTVSEIMSLSNHIEDEANFWHSNFVIFQKAGKILYGKDVFSTQEVFLLKKLLELLSQQSNDFLKYVVSPEIFSITNKHLLDQFILDLKKILDIEKKLKSSFDLDLIDALNCDIKNMIYQLTQKNMFSYLNADYRKAQKLYTSIALVQSEKIDEKIALLKEVLTLKNLQKEFLENTAFQNLLGKNYNGLKTDLMSLEKCNSFINELSTYSSNLFNEFCALIQNNKQEDMTLLYQLSQKITHTDIEFVARKTYETNYSDYEKNNAGVLQNLKIFSNYLVKSEVLEKATFKIIYKTEKDIQEYLKLKDILINKNKDVSLILKEEAKAEKTNIDKIIPTLQLATHFFSKKYIKLYDFGTVENLKTYLEYCLNKVVKILSSLTVDFEEINKIFALLNTKTENYFDETNINDIPLDALYENICILEKSKEESYDTHTYQTLLKNSDKEVYGSMINFFTENALPLSNLMNSFSYLFYKTLSQKYTDKVFYDFLPNQLTKLSQSIRDMDKKVFQENQNYLCDVLNNIPVPEGNNAPKALEKTELQLILHQIAGNSRPIPLRRFLSQAGKAIQALKPCFLMSPTSLAQYIAPNKLSFDLVIIDEGSQLRFEEALGCVLRAKQLIIAGDEKQLPATSFFQKSFSQDADEDIDDNFDVGQSILEKAIACGFKSRELLWHYRSKDPALIAFSNNYFYNNNLKLFPSTSINSQIEGIQYHYVGGLCKASQNEDEVNAIIKEVKLFVRQQPNHSLGIVTMNLLQKKLLEEKFKQLETEDPVFSKYKEKWDNTLERFFIKNLEWVQGDERDFIFISTIFGPESSSGKVLQRFGPINSKFGHRRLNVLFTRAKYGLKLFTSMKADDINVKESSSEGLRVLKNYLLYAETGRLENGVETKRGVDSYFEQMVKDILESKGYEVVPQVGVKGFFIDLAVKHPKNKSYFMLGIECDGAPYHSTKSARDRDCIRQQILESLGWKIYRIWSKDWFYNTDNEIERLLKKIQELEKFSPTQECSLPKEKDNQVDNSEMNKNLANRIDPLADDAVDVILLSDDPKEKNDKFGKKNIKSYINEDQESLFSFTQNN